MERIGNLLGAFRIPVLTLSGYEADDVIGTIARQGIAQGVNVVIVSGDKDFQQLVRLRVWLLTPGRGGPAGVEEQWVSEENGDARLGVPPNRVTDSLALVGDSAAHIPGVRGIGDKAAPELVTAFGDLESILRAAPPLTKKRPREALLEHADLARLSKDLVTIRDDLPLTLALEDLKTRAGDTTRLRQLFVELEFHTLTRTLGDALAADSVTADGTAATAVPSETIRPSTAYRTFQTVTQFNALVPRVKAPPDIALAIESVSDPD